MLHRNLSLKGGYYFNSYSAKDRGVDIMRVWVGDLDNPSNINSSIGRSFFLRLQMRS